MARRDPRESVFYARMNEIMDFLESYGACPLEEICAEMQLWPREFRAIRYSLGGRLAMEDRKVTIPRPVGPEGYVYKLSSTYQSGDVDTDGEPNMQTAFSDVLTRQATVYVDVEKLVGSSSGRIKKLLRKYQKALDAALDRMEDVVAEAGAPVSAWAQTVLDRIA